jgi:hypothetical protein
MPPVLLAWSAVLPLTVFATTSSRPNVCTHFRAIGGQHFGEDYT